MNVLAHDIQNMPVISLQTGDTVATLQLPVIDMGTLKVAAFRCEALSSGRSMVLLPRDIRQFATDGLLIDNEDELSEPHDLVRLSQLLKQDFNPIGKAVVTDMGRRLGTIENYALDLEHHHIQTIIVKPPMLRSWLGSNLTIDRVQIVDVTPKKVVVRDAVMLMPAESLPQSPA
jgi:sporulation protein YlmC with PRC-barrel domain